MTAVSRARICQLVMDRNKRAVLVSKLRKEKETIINSVLLGNNAVNIAASAIATTLSVRLFGDSSGLIIVTVIITLLAVIFWSAYIMRRKLSLRWARNSMHMVLTVQ